MASFPDVSTGESIRISATTFVAYTQCPAMAEARLRGIYGPDSRPSFVGGLAHRLFARHLRNGPIDDFPLACKEEIGASNLNHKLGPLGLTPSSLGKVIEEVGVMYDRFKRVSMDGFERAEVAIEVEPSEGLTLVGVVDAVFSQDRGIKLVDWKTYGLGEVAIQLRFYAFLWFLDGRGLPSQLEALSIGTGEQYSVVPTNDDMASISTEIAEMVTYLRLLWERGSEPRRDGGPWCRFCPLLDQCDEGRTVMEMVPG